VQSPIAPKAILAGWIVARLITEAIAKTGNRGATRPGISPNRDRQRRDQPHHPDDGTSAISPG